MDYCCCMDCFVTDAAAAREGRTGEAAEGVVCVTPGTTAVQGHHTQTTTARKATQREVWVLKMFICNILSVNTVQREHLH